MNAKEKMEKAIEILNERFNFIKDFELIIEKEKFITGGFYWTTFCNGFGTYYKHPIFDIFFRYDDSQYESVEDIVENCTQRIKDNLKMMKSSDEETAIERGEPVKYSCDYSILEE
jgi:hypothetical protein|nr:MAG TPA: hypothetical protein [Caudoviricetes sp.]